MSEPAEIIRREIAECGVLSFARFMELALYCPNSGYYETKTDSPGRRGDFYTSVSVGELFGQLLAFRFAEWLDEIKSPNPQPLTLNLIEAGAHDGTLARDILAWLQTFRPGLFRQIEYCIFEPSARRRDCQGETLKAFAPRVRWFSRFNDSTVQRFNGIIFSNELLDAMPVHRYGWDAKEKEWFEWGVTFEGGEFIWARMTGPVHASRFMIRDSRWEAVLPDGYLVETCPAAGDWWREAANVLERGRLLAIDYGLTHDELFSPGRPRGTLRAYFRHHASDDLLANVGGQDLTAHVNFSAIQSAGEARGLQTETFSTQAQFLTKIAEKIFKDPKSFGEWGTKQTRQFQTLTHPEHLGHAFRVLVQSRPGAPYRLNS